MPLWPPSDTFQIVAARAPRLTRTDVGETAPPGAEAASVLLGMYSQRLSAYAALLFVIIGIVQLAASLLFYRAIDEQTLREDHARRVAELLVVGDRVFRLDDDRTAAVMSSRHLNVTIAAKPFVVRSQATDELQQIGRQILRWEPSLAEKPLHLATRPAEGGRRDLIGSMQLASGEWLNFQSRDISSMWPIALRATWMTLVTALVSLALGLLAIRLITSPLRRLSEAAGAIGQGRRVDIRENGPTDVRNLAHAMNEMQDRIARLLQDQAKSFEAISHDLRTPLARQKLAAELINDPEIGGIINASTDEMEAMLQSLQQYLRAQHLPAERETIDLERVLRSLAAPCRDRIRLRTDGSADVETYPEPLMIALRALIEKACHFGQTVDVKLERAGTDWIVEIADDGPGIPPEHFEDVLTPFFRLDEARGRTTAGFGLGIPTAHRLLTRFGGKLSFASPAGGGLTVRVQIPRPT